MKKVLIEAELFLHLVTWAEMQETEIQGRAPWKSQQGTEEPGLLDPRFLVWVGFGRFWVFLGFCPSSQEDTQLAWV